MMIQINTNITAMVSRLKFSFTDGSMRKIVIIFGACMSSCVHIDNKNKDILFLGEGTTEGLDDVTLTAGAKHPINFTKHINDVY